MIRDKASGHDLESAPRIKDGAKENSEQAKNPSLVFLPISFYYIVPDRSVIDS